MTLVPRERIDPKTSALAAVETDDVVSAWFCCKEGVHGHLFASRATPSSGDKAFIEVVGPEGALKASLSRGSVDVLKLSRPVRPAWEGIPLPEGASDGQAHCLPRMMGSFVEACLRGKLDGAVDASFHDGLAVQQAMEAVQEASRKQAWIRLAGDDGSNASADPSLLRHPSV